MRKMLIILIILISISLNATNSLEKLKLGCDLGNEKSCNKLMSLDNRQNIEYASTPKMSSDNGITIKNKKKIFVTGYGISKEQALDNAFKIAVEQHVGVVVDSDTIIKNGNLIKDEILTASNGFIQTYKELSANEENGLFTIKIEAIVKSQKVFNKIKSLNITTITMQSAKDISARVTTKIKVQKDTSRILKKAIEKIFSTKSLKEMIEVEIISSKAEEGKIINNMMPIKTTYSLKFNSNIYDQKIEQLEEVFKNLGAELYSKVDTIDIHKKDSEEIVLTFDKKNNTKTLTANDFGILKRNGTCYRLNIWRLPEGWKNIFPFNATDSIEWEKQLQIILSIKGADENILLETNITPIERFKYILLAGLSTDASTYSVSQQASYAPKIIVPKLLDFKTLTSLKKVHRYTTIELVTVQNINIEKIKDITNITISVKAY